MERKEKENPFTYFYTPAMKMWFGDGKSLALSLDDSHKYLCAHENASQGGNSNRSAENLQNSKSD